MHPLGTADAPRPARIVRPEPPAQELPALRAETAVPARAQTLRAIVWTVVAGTSYVAVAAGDLVSSHRGLLLGAILAVPYVVVQARRRLRRRMPDGRPRPVHIPAGRAGRQRPPGPLARRVPPRLRPLARGVEALGWAAFAGAVGAGIAMLADLIDHPWTGAAVIAAALTSETITLIRLRRLEQRLGVPIWLVDDSEDQQELCVAEEPAR